MKVKCILVLYFLYSLYVQERLTHTYTHISFLSSKLNYISNAMKIFKWFLAAETPDIAILHSSGELIEVNHNDFCYTKVTLTII
jgi:hypothetical protein